MLTEGEVTAQGNTGGMCWQVRISRLIAWRPRGVGVPQHGVSTARGVRVSLLMLS